MASSSSGSVCLQFIKSKRGKQKLIRAGYQYNLNIKNKSGSSNWRCINREICNGSITVSSDNASILGERQHCCKPNYFKNEIDSRMDVCKNRVQNEFKSVSKIFEECFEDLNSSDSDYCDTPTFISKANSLYNARKKAFHISKCRFKTCKEICLPKILKDNFLLPEISEDDGFLAFASPFFLELCTQTDLLLGDGTFQTVPSPFYQLFTLHIDSGSSREYTSIVPAIYCLLTNKQQSTYEKLFRYLKNKCNISLNFFKCDYEQGLINAVKEVYPQVKVKGCFFHFKRAIIRKAKELGMMENKKLKKYVYLICNLALIPKEFIPEGFLAINEKLPDGPATTQFVEYFTSQWIHKITADVWCCAHERHRTTNSLEAWHNRLKIKVEEKENLFLYINTLKKEAKFYERKVKSKQNNKRKVRTMLKERKIEEEVTNLIKGRISVEHCLNKLCWLK